MSDYTTEPTHLRVYREETGDENVWHIDGADNEGGYTELVWTFATLEEAFQNAKHFVCYAGMGGAQDSVTWKWDAGRSTSIRPQRKAEAL